MLRSLFNSLSAKKSATTKRPHRARLEVAALEERTLMAAGVLDPSFSFDGKSQAAFDDGGQNEDAATAMAVQADGKIVVVGWAQGPNGDADFAVTRFNADGSPDTSFSPGGTDGDSRVRIPFDFGGGKNDKAYAVTIQDDGKIVIAGQVERNNGDYDMGVVRLNADGTLDTAGFGAGTGKTFVAFDIGGNKDDAAFGVTMNGDKIVLVGHAQVAALNYDMAVAQLESDGSLDNDFGAGGADGDGRTTVKFDLGGLMFDVADEVAMQGNKIIVAGHAHTNGSGVDMAVARLNGVSGALDTSFSPGGVEGDGKALVSYDLGGNKFDDANAIAIQSDGKIVLAGTVERSTPGDYDFAVARLNADGTPDNSFGGGDGKQQVAFDLHNTADDDRAYGVAIQSDGKIVVGGTVATGAADNTDFGIARLDTNGNPDDTFSPGGTDGGNGKTTVAFDLGNTDADSVAGIGLQSGDRVVVAGTVQRSNAGDTDFGVARLLADPPAAPVVTSPKTPLVVDATSFSIQGTAEAGTLVKVYKDVNNNNQIDPGDVVVGQQQLGALESDYAITVPLTQSAGNFFLVTATRLGSESAASDVGAIFDVAPVVTPPPPDGVSPRIVKKKGKTRIEVRGGRSGMLRAMFGPYTGKVRVGLSDVNGDGTQDLLIQTVKNGKKRLRVYSGVDLGQLPSPR